MPKIGTRPGDIARGVRRQAATVKAQRSLARAVGETSNARAEARKARGARAIRNISSTASHISVVSRGAALEREARDQRRAGDRIRDRVDQGVTDAARSLVQHSPRTVMSRATSRKRR